MITSHAKQSGRFYSGFLPEFWKTVFHEGYIITMGRFSYLFLTFREVRFSLASFLSLSYFFKTLSLINLALTGILIVSISVVKPHGNALLRFRLQFRIQTYLVQF